MDICFAFLRVRAPAPRVVCAEEVCHCLPACLNSPTCGPRQPGAHRIGRHAGKPCVVLLPKTSGPIRGPFGSNSPYGHHTGHSAIVGMVRSMLASASSQPAQARRSTTASPRHGSQGPGGPGCRGRTRCDSLSCGARPVSSHHPWTFSPARFPFGGFRPQQGQRRASGQENRSRGNAIRASRNGPRSRDGRYRSRPFPAKAPVRTSLTPRGHNYPVKSPGIRISGKINAGRVPL